MDVIGGRYTCVPEGKHGRGQGTGKYKCFKERVIYIRGPSTAPRRNGFMCLSGNNGYEAINFENRD